MKLRSFFLTVVIFALAGTQFPDVMKSLGIAGNPVSIAVPAGLTKVDSEVRDPEEFYSVLYDAILNVKEKVKVRVADYDETKYSVDEAFHRALRENAGLGFVSACNATVSQTVGKASAIMELELTYSYTPEKVAGMRKEADRAAEEIVGSVVSPVMSDYEKVLALHDYLIKNSRYDVENANSDTVPAEEHEAYGVLVNGIGVCDSYAKAFKLLMDKAGVECLLVEGSSTDASGQGTANLDHAWNIVSLDGEYYHIDTTWDDVAEDRDSEDLVYHYLNLDDEDMLKTHQWDMENYPECLGTKYNYYRYNRLYARNLTEAQTMMTKALSARKEKLMVRVADYDSSAYDVEGMIRKAAEKSGIRQGISASWIINDSLGILDIKFEY
ncbi:MAG: transglutaminase domain-containing protein [Pseudomonadota bacterium]